MKNNPVIFWYEYILLDSVSKEDLVTLTSWTSWINKNSKFKNNHVILEYEYIILDSVSRGRLWHHWQAKLTKIKNECPLSTVNHTYLAVTFIGDCPSSLVWSPPWHFTVLPLIQTNKQTKIKKLKIMMSTYNMNPSI